MASSASSAASQDTADRHTAEANFQIIGKRYLVWGQGHVAGALSELPAKTNKTAAVPRPQAVATAPTSDALDPAGLQTEIERRLNALDETPTMATPSCSSSKDGGRGDKPANTPVVVAAGKAAAEANVEVNKVSLERRCKQSKRIFRLFRLWGAAVCGMWGCETYIMRVSGIACTCACTCARLVGCVPVCFTHTLSLSFFLSLSFSLVWAHHVSNTNHVSVMCKRASLSLRLTLARARALSLPSSARPFWQWPFSTVCEKVAAASSHVHRKEVTLNLACSPGSPCRFVKRHHCSTRARTTPLQR